MKNKRIISAVTALVMMGIPAAANVSCFAVPGTVTAYAEAADSKEQHIWDGTEDTSWYYREHKVITQRVGNEDKKIAVFDISTPEELAGLGKLVRSGNTMENTIINLTADVKLNDTSDFADWDKKAPANNWTPIGEIKLDTPYIASWLDLGADKTSFSGVFNGNGHSIEGMYCMHKNFAGLFGHVSMGVISNVIVKDSYVIAKSPQDRSWDTVAGGIVAACSQSVIALCEFDGKVEAYGINHVGNGQHKSCAGGIVGEFEDKEAGWVMVEMVFMMFGVIVNPLLLMGGEASTISSPGVYCCINRGDIYATEGTYSFGNGAGGIIGTGNHDLCISRCYNEGKITSGNGYVGGIAGNAYNFPMANCYYTGADVGLTLKPAGSTKDNAVNIDKADLSKQATADLLGNAFEYKDGAIRLVRSDDEIQDDEITTSETDIFNEPVYDFKVTLAAPTAGWNQTTSWGKPVDGGVTIWWKASEEVSNCDCYIYSDPEYTDLLYSCSSNNGKIELSHVPDGVTFYSKLRGRTKGEWKDPDCEFTEWSYLSFGLGIPKGDINKDGVVNVSDISMLAAHVKGIKKLSDTSAADLNGDGNVNVTDISMLAAHVKGIKKLG